jgi:hypothetical protein
MREMPQLRAVLSEQARVFQSEGCARARVMATGEQHGGTAAHKSEVFAQIHTPPALHAGYQPRFRAYPGGIEGKSGTGVFNQRGKNRNGEVRGSFPVLLPRCVEIPVGGCLHGVPQQWQCSPQCVRRVRLLNLLCKPIKRYREGGREPSRQRLLHILKGRRQPLSGSIAPVTRRNGSPLHGHGGCAVEIKPVLWTSLPIRRDRCEAPLAVGSLEANPPAPVICGKQSRRRSATCRDQVHHPVGAFGVRICPHCSITPRSCTTANICGTANAARTAPHGLGVSPAARGPGFARSRATNNVARLRRATPADRCAGGLQRACAGLLPSAAPGRPCPAGANPSRGSSRRGDVAAGCRGAARPVVTLASSLSPALASSLRRVGRLRRAFVGGSAPHTPTFRAAGSSGGGVRRHGGGRPARADRTRARGCAVRRVTATDDAA